MLKKISLISCYISLILITLGFGHNVAASQFLTLSDIHYGPNNSIDDKNTGDSLWQIALNKFNELSASADFIIFLGDLPDHNLKKAIDKSEVEAKLFHDLYQLSNRKPIFYIPGNNDSLLGNYQPFSYNGVSPLNNTHEWEGGACAHCEGLLIDDSLMREKGYYSSYVIPNNKDVVLIALNATQFSQIPWWIPPYFEQEKDAIEQLDWLAKQLNQLHANQLLIAMHQQPGVDYRNKLIWQKKHLTKFIQLLHIAQKNNQEVTLLASHSHYDEIRKITLTTGEEIFSYSTPSISRIHNNNSAMKVFELNNDCTIKNFITYFTPSNEHWANDHYQAINCDKDSIFPSCNVNKLRDCLVSLSNEEVCNRLQTQRIYGVKNPQVKITNCLKSYVVN